MLAIVVLACDEGVQTTGQAIDRDVEGRIVFVGEDDVEVAVELGSGKLSEVLRHERQADPVTLRALRRVSSRVDRPGEWRHGSGYGLTWPTMSFCISRGKSTMLSGFCVAGDLPLLPSLTEAMATGVASPKMGLLRQATGNAEAARTRRWDGWLLSETARYRR